MALRTDPTQYVHPCKHLSIIKFECAHDTGIRALTT